MPKDHISAATALYAGAGTVPISPTERASIHLGHADDLATAAVVIVDHYDGLNRIAEGQALAGILTQLRDHLTAVEGALDDIDQEPEDAAHNPVLMRLAELEPDNLRTAEALDLVYELKKLADSIHCHRSAPHRRSA